MRAIMHLNLIIQTVEAEITITMPLQRACVAESQVRKQVVKWTAEGAVKCDFTKYSATLQADVICRGYVGILLSARVMP